MRPALGERLVQALNDDVRPRVRSLGSLGASDLAAMADIAHGVFTGLELAPGEGLALINSSAFGTGAAALAMAAAARLLDAGRRGWGAVPRGLRRQPVGAPPGRGPCAPRPGAARDPGAPSAACSRGIYLWAEGAARNFRTRFTYRSTPTIQAAARRALEHGLSVLEVELNAAQGKPLVDLEDGLILSASVYEVVGLSAALDYVRTVLGFLC